MKWVQWSSNDLKSGLGGVEVHARALDREFKKLGVESSLSSSAEVLDSAFSSKDLTIVHTHGSASLPWRTARKLKNQGVVLVHTLHGSTLGRMQACKEWLWPGGYAAYLREWKGVFYADLVLGVHPDIHFLDVAQKLRKRVAVCSNGWDHASEAETKETSAISAALHQKIPEFGPYFCFVGRGNDQMKNTQFLCELLNKDNELKIVAIPGEGFPDSSRVLKTGRLTGGAIAEVLKKSKGLLLSSHYEGLPLVVLEALGHGVPVLSTSAGGMHTLPENLQNLYILPLKHENWIARIHESLIQVVDSEQSAAVNRSLLPTWKQVAEIALHEVQALAKSDRS